jgi:hypothetical protein
MGAACSVLKVNNKSFNISETDVIKFIMPIYYTAEIINHEDILMASLSWQTVLNNLSPQFLDAKGDSSFTYSSCVVYFYDSFFTRLFDIHPQSKVLFNSGMKHQGKFLTKLINLSISEFSIKKKSDLLKRFTELYDELGFQAAECKYIHYLKFKIKFVQIFKIF